jgi:ribose transport system permease protein
LSKVFVSPTHTARPRTPGTGAGSPYELNNRLSPVGLIGLGEVDAPEDIILDEDNNLYIGNRTGDIIRFLAPDYKNQDIFAHVGGIFMSRFRVAASHSSAG